MNASPINLLGNNRIQRFVFATLLLFLCHTFILSQDVSLLTQSQVDAFDPTTTSVDGTLRIGILSTPNDIVDISNLSNITSVTENLIIRSNDILTNIDGLSSIITVGGYLDITSNDSLPNIDGLINLTSVGNYLEINSNDVLNNIRGLSNIDSIGNYIEIRKNDVLVNLDGLQKIDGNNNYIEISRNPNLQDLTGLDNLKAVAGSLEVNFNSSITNINALSKLTQVGNDLEVRANPLLSDCCGIQDLLLSPESILGDIRVNSNLFGCASTFEVINKECEITLVVNANSPCEGLQNGSISVITGQYDAIPINYTWLKQEDGQMGMGQSFDGNFIIENLDEGTYDLTVHSTEYDSVYRNDISLTSLAGSIFEVLEVQTINSTNSFNNGSINIKVTGGMTPYNATWTGPSIGNLPDITSTNIDITNILPGVYNIVINDANGNGVNVPITLLDEDVPLVECVEPLDIVILNDVSQSVTSREYEESQIFFIDLILHTNIGFGPEESRASIVEWSNQDQQEVKIPFTGDSLLIKTYLEETRSFTASTSIGAALLFAKNHLNANGRPGAKKVIILSTDATSVSPNSSITAIANVLKAQGIHIVTIAFDAAYFDTEIRQTLGAVSSIGGLAPGAPAYQSLDIEIAQEIVDFYICPIDPGETSTVYFSRDGSITIDDINSVGSCLYPDYAEIEITIEAFNELSIPLGTPISFYLNDPTQPGASYLMTWLLPCGVPVGTSGTFIINLPINTTSHIFAILNDDGSTSIPLMLPTTDIEENNYFNNIDSIRTCNTLDTTIIQVTKNASLPLPACDSIVYYNVNICNISNYTADSINVIDQAPLGAILVDSIANTNNCATVVDGAFNIPPSCCVTINYSYDFSETPFGFYNDQDIILTTPDNVLSLNFDGAYSSNENVLWDGTVDCPSTTIEFSKAVSTEESCDDNYIQFTFTINNEMNIPLQGLTFEDILPQPCHWFFQPYNTQGLSISNVNINENIAEFTIAEVAPNTVVSFSIDANLNIWSTSGVLNNTATLDNVPDAVNGGLITLTSNSTATDIIASPTLIAMDTIIIGPLADTINLTANLNGIAVTNWTTASDGYFSAPENLSTSYVLGEGDLQKDTINLFISAESDCHQIGQNVILIKDKCLLNLDAFTISDCNDNGTEEIENDDYFIVEFNIQAVDLDNDNYNFSVDNVFVDTYSYNTTQSISLPADGSVSSLTFTDSQFAYCSVSTTVMQENCSVSCIDFEVSIESDTSTTIILGESINIFIIGIQEEDTYNWSNGSTEDTQTVTPTESITYTVTVTDIDGCTSTASIDVEVITVDCEIYIPNAFSPNGDNVNDIFYIRSNSIKSMEIYIYNRWGEEVFRSAIQSDGWNGNHNGQLLAPDSFAYYFKAECNDGETIERQGNISIMR